MLNIGVLISGRGSNLQALIDACQRQELPAKIALVISNNPEAQGLERAKKHGIPSVVVNPKDFSKKSEYESAVVEQLQQHRVGLVCLAGYMKIVGPGLLGAFPQKVLNVHPALLPAFPGLNAQKQALDHGVKVSGATVHFVDEGCDTGPIIMQAAVPVLEDDTEESLAARILKEEHRLYPAAVKAFAEGRLKIEGRRVRIR